MRNSRESCSRSSNGAGMRRVRSISSAAASISAPSSRARATGSGRVWVSMRHLNFCRPLRPTAPALSRAGAAWLLLAALQNGQAAQPVEQIKQAAIAGGDVVALDALRAFGNVGQEMADLARAARVGNVDQAQPVGEPCGRDLGSRHLFARLMAGRELRLRRAVVKAVDLEARERHRVLF